MPPAKGRRTGGREGGRDGGREGGIPANSPPREVWTIMEFAYDHVLIESSSPADEIGVHMTAACAENETRRYTYNNNLYSLTVVITFYTACG